MPEERPCIAPHTLIQMPDPKLGTNEVAEEGEGGSPGGGWIHKTFTILRSKMVNISNDNDVLSGPDKASKQFPKHLLASKRTYGTKKRYCLHLGQCVV